MTSAQTRTEKSLDVYTRILPPLLLAVEAGLGKPLPQQYRDAALSWLFDERLAGGHLSETTAEEIPGLQRIAQMIGEKLDPDGDFEHFRQTLDAVIDKKSAVSAVSGPTKSC